MTVLRHLWHRIWRTRYLLLRRTTQLLAMLLLMGAVLWNWSVLRGNLSFSWLLDTVPFADPYAVLQMAAAGVAPTRDLLMGAAITLTIYALVLGRAFCAWICPLNAVTDLAGWLRRRLGLSRGDKRGPLPAGLRHGILLLSLVLSALLGVAAFEAISPVAMTHRGLIYGMGLGWAVIAAIFIFDLLVQRNAFCGYLCPLGAFYVLVTRGALLRVNHDQKACTLCMDCKVVCPESQILAQIGKNSGFVLAGECTNCGRCVEVCRDDALSFGLAFGRRRLRNIDQPQTTQPALETADRGGA
jgi:ferredoxin-type protein NapH